MASSSLDFAPGILRTQDEAPSPLPKVVLYTVVVLFGILLIWALLGRLDIISVAQGKLVPDSYVKIVQPADSGIVKEILVREGEEVIAGQVLMRMDAQVSDADSANVDNDLQLRRLQLRRIDAELADRVFPIREGERPELYRQAADQYRANRESLTHSIGSERAVLERARQELRGAEEMRSRLEQIVPIYQDQEAAHDKLVKDGFVSKLAGMDKTRERIEKEQELKAQAFQVESLKAQVDQSQKKLGQITALYRQQLQNERAQAHAQLLRLEQEGAKQTYRRGLLELRAPHDGMVKDLATHTPGTVVSPGTILMTVVPHNEQVKAEVWVPDVDAGFVRVGQKVKVKLAAYPFQKYGMVEGRVDYLSPDAAELPDTRERDRKDTRTHVMPPSGFRALVALDSAVLERGGRQYRVNSGMLVSAEIHLGTRTVMEYLLSPVSKTLHEAGREL